MNAPPKAGVILAPPFTRETAILKVRAVEDNWNSRDPERVARGYAVDCYWRNRAEFLRGRDEVMAFLTRKWTVELDYRLIKEIWTFDETKIAVRFAYESHDKAGQWYRSYGNENWEFDSAGLSKLRYASINDLPVEEEDRLFRWPLGRRPDEHPGLTELGL
jgi:nuclear transport factor 2 (NTF2) superfamily protein